LQLEGGTQSSRIFLLRDLITPESFKSQLGPLASFKVPVPFAEKPSFGSIF
jgi:hypothetical protein